jgi:hypothetical protein
MAQLEHDPKLIERLALAYTGNAAAHLELTEAPLHDREILTFGGSQHELLGASSLVIAASYWSLIDPNRAVVLYRHATAVYRAMGHSYWMVLALASGSRNDIFRIPSAFDEMSAPTPQAIAFAMVAEAMGNSERQSKREERLNTAWRHVGNAPVGRLGIPLDHYGRCAEAMRAARNSRNIERFFTEAGNYVRRAAEIVRTASHDQFHWRRLQSTVLPAEPEAVAMTTAMSIMAHAAFRMPITEMSELDAHGRLLVDMGEQMRNAAQREGER